MLQLLNPSQLPASERSTRNLASSLYDTAKELPSKEAIVYGDRRTTYGELEKHTQAIAWQLQSLGVTRGDKVALLFPNHPEFVASLFAVLTVGAVVVPVNPLLKSEEIRHILADSAASVLIVHQNGFDEAARALPGLPALKHVIVSREASLNKELINSLSGECALPIISLTPGLLPPSPVTPQDEIPDTDLALIVYTSGTTGKPKGAMLTHANVRAVMPEPLLGHCNINSADRWLAMLPLCHVYGLGVIVYTTMATGGSIYILEKFDAVAALQLIQDEKLTLLPAVPSMYQFMLMELQKQHFDVSSIRVCFSGAAALTPEVMEATQNAFGAPVVEGYALSETACGATINRIDARKIGSIGKPLDGIELAIFDESGAALPSGREFVGEIAIRGKNVMAGYHNQPEATAEVMNDGWFLTGDLGYQDEEGYYFIVGRKKEMIIRGGQNIYPREIEDVIMRMDGVREAAVIGIPDSYMGERVKAIVVPKANHVLDEGEIKEYCARNLAPYKVPRLVEVRSDLLPRNSTGKVLKRLLT